MDAPDPPEHRRAEPAVPPMNLLARGRDCDVFDLGDGTVLRQQRDGRSLEAEATVMRHVASHGFPCPAVHGVDGPQMVLDLLEGPTMAQQLLEDSTVDRAREAGVVLAELHGQLHGVPPLVGVDGCALHLDLHPENVVLAPGGPVVIVGQTPPTARPNSTSP